MSLKALRRKSKRSLSRGSENKNIHGIFIMHDVELKIRKNIRLSDA